MQLRFPSEIMMFLMAFPLGISWAQGSESESATLRAFGGHINIPAYMEVLVQFTTPESIELKMLRKLDSAGEIRSLIINRHFSASKKSETTRLTKIAQYELNDFAVQLFEPHLQLWKSNLKLALISRCGESGNVIVESKEALDQFLIQASPADCA